MADKIDTVKLKAEVIKTIKAAIETYSKTVQDIRSRELKKAELCLLCGNEDQPDKCTCLSKADKNVGFKLTDLKNAKFPKADGKKFNPATGDFEQTKKNSVMGYGDANGASGAGGAPSMAMAEGDAGYSVSKRTMGGHVNSEGHEVIGTRLRSGKIGGHTIRKLSGDGGTSTPIKTERHAPQSENDTKGPCKICNAEAMFQRSKFGKSEHSAVQGAMAVEDKKEQGAVLPDDKKSKDDQNDEGSGGLTKDESLAGLKAPGKAGKTVADLRARSMHPDTADSLAEVKGLPGNTKTAVAAMGTHLAAVNKPKLPMVKKEMSKTSVEQANKELGQAKSIVSSPTKMPGGGKVVNPNAMSPGNGPKPKAGMIKSERVKEVLGKCALCKNDEHMGGC